MAKPIQPLKLLAETSEDLAVISAALQDAVAKVGDIAFDARARTLTLALNRYRWEARGAGERVRVGLQLNGVLGVKSQNLRLGAKEAVVDMLSLAFEAGEAPGGDVLLTFAGGGALRATVECVDVVLADLSAPWPARTRPQHD